MCSFCGAESCRLCICFSFLRVGGMHTSAANCRRLGPHYTSLTFSNGLLVGRGRAGAIHEEVAHAREASAERSPPTGPKREGVGREAMGDGGPGGRTLTQEQNRKAAVRKPCLWCRMYPVDVEPYGALSCISSSLPCAALIVLLGRCFANVRCSQIHEYKPFFAFFCLFGGCADNRKKKA